MRGYDARLMSGRLPAQIDPIRLADEGVRLAGELPGSELGRLRELARPGSRPAPVTVDLKFERTAHGARLMRGRLETTIEAVCQRCLQPVALALLAEPLIALLVPGEVVAGAPEEAETLVVEGPLVLSELAEDELLLAMPMIPVHGEGECAAPGTAKAPPRDGVKPNPFEALRGFKSKD